MDHVQVFAAKSVSGLRSFASGLIKLSRPDPWMTVPAASATSAAAATDDAAAAATNDDEAIAEAAASAAAHNVAVAEAMSVTELENAQAVQADTSDEFLY